VVSGLDRIVCSSAVRGKVIFSRRCGIRQGEMDVINELCFSKH
jgi:hypothetical protein